jgi:hypothetical protein
VYRAALNRDFHPRSMCEKRTGPIRCSQFLSMPTPSMRSVFQASAMLVSNACAPDMAAMNGVLQLVH